MGRHTADWKRVLVAIVLVVVAYPGFAVAAGNADATTRPARPPVRRIEVKNEPEAYVGGLVTRPGFYSLTPHASSQQAITLRALVASAGITPQPPLDQLYVQVRRYVTDDQPRQIIEVDLKPLFDRQVKDIPVEDGSVLIVGQLPRPEKR
jgi:protein involved in polysaccharide export with SLBB domain